MYQRQVERACKDSANDLGSGSNQQEDHTDGAEPFQSSLIKHRLILLHDYEKTTELCY